MGLPWVYGLFLSLMGGKMGLQKAILEGKLALYPWQIFSKNSAETEWKTVSDSFGEFWRILQKNNIR